MNIGSWLSLIKFFKYPSIISIYSTKNRKKADTAKNIFEDLRCIIDANVLLKSIPGIEAYLCITSLALYPTTDLTG